MMSKQFVADFSLALINRTGAYYACRDIVRCLPQFFSAIRYWRLFLGNEPRGLTRKLLGRAMLLELSKLTFTEALARPREPRVMGAPMLFFDPLYVLRTRLEARDIVLCHDVGPITHPELFDATTRQLYQTAYERIRAIGPGMVFVSYASRSAFESSIKASCRFQRVIPLYVRAALNEGSRQSVAGIRAPFLLTVGGLEKRKNHLRIIEAFIASGLRERGYSYVFCGPRGNSAQEVGELAKTVPGVHNLGYLGDAELRWLYSKAAGFVLPSLLEGFGLPALEAAQYGLVSIVSAGGAQEEAVGGGAVLVDPTSVADIVAGMQRLVSMRAPERKQRLASASQLAEHLSQGRYLAQWAELLASQ
jgi:glycosyltransferase involved in cell wall biosynthesis